MTTRLAPMSVLAWFLGCLLLPLGARQARAETAAANGPAHCGKCGEACGHGQLTACTVMVPMQVVEVRYKSCVVTEPQQSQETYTEFRRVPEKLHVLSRGMLPGGRGQNAGDHQAAVSSGDEPRGAEGQGPGARDAVA